MNKFKYIFGLAMTMIIASCTDFVEPAIPYNGFDTGVYLRTITATTAVSAAAMSTATFDLTVEAVDEQNGALVEQVVIFCSRRRGATVLPEAQVATIAKSAFQASSTQYLRASTSITMTSVLAALGLPANGIVAGDFVEFRLVCTDSKGRTFSNNNLSSDVAGGVYYRSPFFYRVTVGA